MTPNSISPPLTGATSGNADDGFARRRINDLAGLAAIVSVAFVVSLITGVDTPAFALVLFAALGALAYGEQRLSAAAPQRQTTSQHSFNGWQPQS